VRKGPPGLERLFLHAWQVEFPARTGTRLIRVSAPLPPELERPLELLRDPLSGLAS